MIVKKRDINRNVKKMRTRHMPEQVIPNSRAYSRDWEQEDKWDKWEAEEFYYLPDAEYDMLVKSHSEENGEMIIPEREDGEELEEYATRVEELLGIKLMTYFIDAKKEIENNDNS